MRISFKSSITKKAFGVAAGVALVLGSAGGALAATGSFPHSGNNTISGCVTGKSRTLENVHSPASSHRCSGGFRLTWNVKGPKGDRGARGPQGPKGNPGVVSTSDTNLVSAAESPLNVPTGGHFSTGKTLVGTVNLTAGTYLVNVNFMATPNDANAASTQVFPQVFVYDGVQKPDFSNDLFNVGSGALEQATQSEITTDPINSYFSGSGEITVPSAGETLDVYAFGYDADSGAGSYALNALHVTATQLNTAG